MKRRFRCLAIANQGHEGALEQIDLRVRGHDRWQRLMGVK